MRFASLYRTLVERLWTPEPEVARLILGATGSGKSEGELVQLVRLADSQQHAIVVLDGHGPLAFAATGHWAQRGHEQRLIYEPLDATDRVLAWPMLPKPTATDPFQQGLQLAEIRDDLVQSFVTQRNLVSLVDKPWTKEWLEAAISLVLAQAEPQSLLSLLHAFRIGTPKYEQLLHDCLDRDLIHKFRAMERLRRQNPVQAELQTGPARRYVEQVCQSEVIRLRARPGTFDWMEAIQQRRLIVFDGGGIRSRELKRSIFTLVSMHVIHAVRQHFAASQRPLPVVLVLEEAGAHGLVNPTVIHALQELRKSGLAIHILSQSIHDFGDASILESLLAHTPWQAFYQLLSPADQELIGKVLHNPTFDPMSVHYSRRRWPRRGNDLHVPRMVEEHYFSPPQLQLQLRMTQLATLKVGERFVRTRRRVWRERVRMLHPVGGPEKFAASTAAMIARLRQGPLYLPPLPVEPVPRSTPPADAATRLREKVGGDSKPTNEG